MLANKDNYVYYDNIINMVYKLGEEKKNAESVRRMAFKAHFSKIENWLVGIMAGVFATMSSLIIALIFKLF